MLMKGNRPSFKTLDYCGSHDLHFNLPNMRLALFLPRLTSKYQLQDPGLIASRKVRYLSILPYCSIYVMGACMSGQKNFAEEYSGEKNVIREG